MTKNYSLRFAEIKDLSSWMDMVELVRFQFPLLELEEELENYKKVVVKNINRKSALCVTSGNIIVGVLLFSYHQKCLSCMAVHPNYRRNGIASTMITKMLSLMPCDQDIWVVTFRDEDEKGKAPRAFIKDLAL